MRITPVISNKSPLSKQVFGMKIKNSDIIQDVFLYNENLLKQGKYEDVALFCKSVNNIFGAKPDDAVYTLDSNVEKN